MARKRILSLESRKDIFEAIQSGMNQNEIAAKFGFTSRTLRNYLRRFGLDYRAIRSLEHEDLDAYLSEKLERVREQLRALPDLRTRWLLLEDVERHRIPTGWWKTYSMRVDPESFLVHIEAVLKNNKTTRFSVSLESLNYAFSREKSLGNGRTTDSEKPI